MKIIIISILTLFVLYTSSNAQTQKPKSHYDNKINCSSCHSCEVPTKENPCLLACPREMIVTKKRKIEEGPDVITINKLKNDENNYKEVQFTHRLHAEMAEFSGGCNLCHHYNPPGKIVGCDGCHNPSRKREDINHIDLKGAYHRQCMDCHRKWSGSTDCVECHQPVKKESDKNKQTKSSAKKVHTKLESPAKIEFKTPKAKYNIVTFFHKEHIELFALDCLSCHTNESCVKCHDKRPVNLKPKRTVDKKHKLCSSCHDTKSNNNCQSCHSEKEVMGFNHLTSTGFSLEKYHAKVKCQKCHTSTGKFTGLTNNCNSCHKSWKKDKFNHKVTGLTLDEAHIDLDCESCHTNASYEKPECTPCHDDKNYPVHLPGKKVKK